MTITDYLISNFETQTSSGAVFISEHERFVREKGERVGTFPFKQSLWINYMFPIGEEKGSGKTTEVYCSGEPRKYVPRTPLGERLLRLRRRAVNSGMRLISADEVLEEVRRRRGELEDNVEDLC